VRAVVQRVTSARVVVAPAAPREGALATTTAKAAEIGRGLVALVGVERGDGPPDVEYIARKIRELRVFEPGGATPPGERANGFDRSLEEITGEVLVVSQFTLAADCRKGRRPAFDAAAPPEIAKPLYESVVLDLRRHGIAVATGQFQAMMQVTLTNDGPVTIWLRVEPSNSPA